MIVAVIVMVMVMVMIMIMVMVTAAVMAVLDTLVTRSLLCRWHFPRMP